jgi:predicted O-linked N-acetylglucosamine transferase (SPINDLY family)
MVKDKKALAVVPRKTPHIENITDKKKVVKAIIPKPTKAEIVEALVTKKYEEWAEERRAWSAKTPELTKAFQDAVRIELRAKPEVMLKDMTVSSTGYDNNKSVKVEFTLPLNKWPVTVQQAHKDLEKHSESYQKIRYDFDRAKVRQVMQEALRCDPARVNALAQSPEIAEVLKHIEANLLKPVITHSDNGR